MSVSVSVSLTCWLDFLRLLVKHKRWDSVSQCKRFSYLLARFLAAVGEAQEVGVSQCKRFSHLLTRLLAAVGEAPRREGISVSVSLTC